MKYYNPILGTFASKQEAEQAEDEGDHTIAVHLMDPPRRVMPASSCPFNGRLLGGRQAFQELCC